MNTVISSCSTYRIVKREDPQNEGVYGYTVELAPTPTAGPKHIYGPVLHPKDARQAAQDHANGMPMQALL